MKPDEIIINGTYSTGLGDIRKVLTIHKQANRGLIVKHELIVSKIKKISSVHQCKLADFANWAWERID